jgi:ABC-type amino acid transport substrate-binding protein
MKKFLIILLFFLNSFFLEAKEIKIASINWCPQLCPNEKKNGYVIDILELIFKDSNYKIDIETYPWTRSIKMTKRAQTLALLSPAKAEAPDLIYPNIEIGKQMMCFFTKKDSSWKYTNIDSLKNLQIGIARDTSIEELNDYIKYNPSQFQFLPYSENYIQQSLRKLDRNRFDTFLFTKNSTLYKINSLGLKGKYNMAGCVSSANIYIAFTSNKMYQKEVKKIMSFFDSRMKKLKKTNKIELILDNYGLEKWFK